MLVSHGLDYVFSKKLPDIGFFVLIVGIGYKYSNDDCPYNLMSITFLFFSTNLNIYMIKS